MADLLDRLFALWIEPVPPADEAARAAFGSVYADPVRVNGTDLPLEDLVARARAIQGALTELDVEIVDRVETPDRIVVGFYLRGRQVGRWVGPLGAVPPTGRQVAIRTTDILTVRAGVVTDIWVVADDLGALMQLDAVALRPAPS